MRLNYFDNFRAIAILLIVAGHSYGSWAIDTFPEKIAANLISGGTALFVFISGFFFHHVFYAKFNYAEFLYKKTKLVFLPYLILSSIAFILIVVILNHPHPKLAHEITGIADFVILYLQYLWTGRVLTAYWYIHFIMIVFLMSPLFIKYIQLPTKVQVSIFLSLLAFSMLIQRPGHDLNPIHSVIYFTPIYLFGIIYSLHEASISRYINNKSFALGALVLLISSTQVLRRGFYGNFHKNEILAYNGIDIIIVQKVILIFFFLSMFKKIGNKEVPVLKYLASVSFAIYFLHPWVLLVVNHNPITTYFLLLPGGVAFLLRTIIAIIACLILLEFIKRVLDKKSRYIIGW